MPYTSARTKIFYLWAEEYPRPYGKYFIHEKGHGETF